MSGWLIVTQVAATLNVLILLGLGSVWVQNYRRHGARHTLGLVIVAAFLLVENVLWVYFYVFHRGFISWFSYANTEVQVGLSMLCGLELLALLALARITVQ